MTSSQSLQLHGSCAPPPDILQMTGQSCLPVQWALRCRLLLKKPMRSFSESLRLCRLWIQVPPRACHLPANV